MRIPATRQLMNTVAATAALLACSTAWAQVTFYANDGFDGRSYTTQAPVNNLNRSGFNDRASSVVVRTDNWQICADANFKGRCMVLRPGQYPSLSAMGMEDRISSARQVKRNARYEEREYAPMPVVTQDYRRRNQERLFEAPVTAVRAVVANSGQRCWVERQNVTEERADNRVPGALLGAVIGGILGHQVGGGSGKDIATAGGVVAGAVVGSNLARNRDGTVSGTRDVQRCEATPGGARPEYWDVTYRFRNKDHTVQLTRPPGATVTVNRNGEPRA
ncbi:MAG: beta/gamma crystallin-related protein [Rubrivivax sp.]|nr:beta/gamma crystallin-related protein [Rubrivivax sp.]